jgi:hypothetical protein
MLLIDALGSFEYGGFERGRLCLIVVPGNCSI